MSIKNQRNIGGHAITINGEQKNIYYARLAYRCQMCLSELEQYNFGLRCKANLDHRGFIHQREAKKIQQDQQENIESLKSFYVVRNGKVELCQS